MDGTFLPTSNYISPLLLLTDKLIIFNGFCSYYFYEEGNVQNRTFLFLYITGVLKYCKFKTHIAP